MSVNILGVTYDIEITSKIELKWKNLVHFPIQIFNLSNLKELIIFKVGLTILPTEIGNLSNMQNLCLGDNKLKSLPKEILKIKDILRIDDTSYDIDNMDLNADFLILTDKLYNKITNLPIFMKEIWIRKYIDVSLIKLPFGCEIKYL